MYMLFKQLISTFIFAIQMVQSLYFLNPKVQASSHIMWMHSPVCIGPSRQPGRQVFSRPVQINKKQELLRRSINLNSLTQISPPTLIRIINMCEREKLNPLFRHIDSEDRSRFTNWLFQLCALLKRQTQLTKYLDVSNIQKDQPKKFWRCQFWGQICGGLT